MKIVVAFGGLGNVMFYYALANALRHKGAKSFVFMSKTNLEHYNYELHKLFPSISYWGNLNAFERLYYAMIQRIRDLHYKKYKVPHKILFYPFIGLYSDQEPVKFLPSVFCDIEQNQFLIGHFQSYKYFEDYRASVLDEFRFSTDCLSENSKQMAKEINSCNSVSIHVRRGDYLNNYYFETLGKICDLDYYNRAIEVINTHVTNAHFFVFSDDPKYVADNLNIKNATYVDFNVGTDSWQDMYLMSQCKHNIIANSTFSWWGAWLNVNETKIVVAPHRWFANIEKDEIVPNEWIRV
jgi:hypothetical protein